MTTKEAVEKITSELVTDAGFWGTYKANIAMAFYDELQAANWEYDSYADVANKAANRFLKSWCIDAQKQIHDTH